MSSETGPTLECQVCGETNHAFRRHLNEVETPEFVHSSVVRLRSLERAGSDIDVLVEETSSLADREEGGRKAWALWLLTLLREMEDFEDAPDVVAEIDDYLSAF